MDWSYHAHQFIFLFFLLHCVFDPCDGLSWLLVSFLLHVKYRIELYRICNCFPVCDGNEHLTSKQTNKVDQKLNVTSYCCSDVINT